MPMITPKEESVPKPHSSSFECANIFPPTKLNKTPKPIGKNRNKPIKLERKKKSDRSPITAKTFEKKTI